MHNYKYVISADFPFTLLPILQSAGILTYFALKSEPGLSITIILLLSCLLTAIYFRTNTCVITICIATSTMISGFMSAQVKSFITSQYTYKSTGVKFINNSVATVDKIYFSNKRSTIIVKMQKNNLIQGKIRLFYAKKINQNIFEGDRVILSAVLANNNQQCLAEYDHRRILDYFDNIVAVGYLTKPLKLAPESEKSYNQFSINYLRKRIYNAIKNDLTGKTSGIASSIIIGYRSDLDEATKQDILNSGIMHLLAISGLHMLVLYTLTSKILQVVFVLMANSSRYDLKKISMILSIPFCYIYLLISGSSISATRAFIMLVCFILCVVLDRNNRPIRAMLIAAFLTLTHSPEAILQPSFQLSFSAVASLIGGSIIIKKIIKRVSSKFLCILIKSIATSTITFLATLPYILYNFHFFTFSGIITNILAIPLTVYAVIPLCVLYCASLITGHIPHVAILLKYSIEQLISLSKLLSGNAIFTPRLSDLSLINITLSYFCTFLSQKRALILSSTLIIFINVLIDFTVNRFVPDILISGNTIVIKEMDENFYYISGRKNSRTIKVLAQRLGQPIILNHKEYKSTKHALECTKHRICSYRKNNRNLGIILQKKGRKNYEQDFSTKFTIIAEKKYCTVFKNGNEVANTRKQNSILLSVLGEGTKMLSTKPKEINMRPWNSNCRNIT